MKLAFPTLIIFAGFSNRSWAKVQRIGECQEFSKNIHDGSPRGSPYYHCKSSFGANIPHQRTNSPMGKPVVLLVLGWRMQDNSFNNKRRGWARRCCLLSLFVYPSFP